MIHLTLIELDMARTGDAPETVTEHLRSCSECRAELEKLCAASESLNSLNVPATFSEDHERDMSAFIQNRAEAIKDSRRPRILVPVFRWAAAVAAAVLILVGSYAILDNDAPKQSRHADSVMAKALEPEAKLVVDSNGDGMSDVIDVLIMTNDLELSQEDVDAMMKSLVSLENNRRTL